MNLAAFEQRLMQHTARPARGRYPADLFPVIERAWKKGVPAKKIAAELKREPEFRHTTESALYRRICRHIASLTAD